MLKIYEKQIGNAIELLPVGGGVPGANGLTDAIAP